MVLMAIGITLGVVLIAVLAAVVIVLAGADPPAEPPAWGLDAVGDRNALFRPGGWKKGRPGGPPAFNRPLEIQAPDDGVLAPPRDVRGVNGEE